MITAIIALLNKYLINLAVSDLIITIESVINFWKIQVLRDCRPP
jgi:hypothetical protein